jgi:hypothetical protein
MEEAESVETLAEFSQQVVADLLASPELSESDWDTFSMCAEVSEDQLGVTAYRYTEAGPPVPTEPAEEVDDRIWDLWDSTRGTDGSTWNVLLLKLHRESGELAVDFVSGEAADRWRITPENMETLPEALRPRPEHFKSD